MIQEMCWRTTENLTGYHRAKLLKSPHRQDYFAFQVLLHCSVEPKMMGCLDPPYKLLEHCSVMSLVCQDKISPCGRAAWSGATSSIHEGFWCRWSTEKHLFLDSSSPIISTRHYAPFCRLKCFKQFLCMFYFYMVSCAIK